MTITCGKCASSFVDVSPDEYHCRSCGNVEVIGVKARWPFVVETDQKRGAILPLINTCKTRIVPKRKLCACGCKKRVKSKKKNALYATKRCQDRVCQKNYRKRHREQENERNRKYMQKRRAAEKEDRLEEACKEMLVGTI